MKKKVSMKDIARQLGVSTALVSYVLNDKFTDRINRETAEKIKELAASLNYTPNRIAQSLKKNRTFTIGLIIADISNLFYSNIARFIEDEAKKNHYNVIFGSADENANKFSDLVEVFLSRQVDGLILAAPADSEEVIGHIRERGIPFVLIDRVFPRVTGADTIMIDNYRASCEVIKHLASKGFRRPAMISLDSELHHLRERSRGFTDSLKKILKVHDNLVIEIEEERLHEETENWVLRLLKTDPPPDSVYFSTNKIAMEGLAVLAKHKIPVPGRLGVICFDEAEAYRIFNTSVTYVKQPLKEIGEEAVKVILAKIDGGKQVRNQMLSTDIIGGDSTSSRG